MAVGECGLDPKAHASAELQTESLLTQLKLAEDFCLPLILHGRRPVHDETLKLLRRVRPSRGGVIHGFSGSLQQARHYIELGFKLGVGGVITYPRANKTRTVFRELELEHLLLETDSPDMPLAGYQGQRNEPLRVVEVFAELCRIRGETQQTVGGQLEQNVQDLFGI